MSVAGLRGVPGGTKSCLVVHANKGSVHPSGKCDMGFLWSLRNILCKISGALGLVRAAKVNDYNGLNYSGRCCLQGSLIPSLVF